jgi:SAM-dependent methyltransferase
LSLVRARSRSSGQASIAKWKAARERLSLLELGADPSTMRTLRKIGVAAGWHCLEVAGGGGSIAAWLCSQVGAAGHVMATDLDPRFLEAIAAPNLEVRRHDILTDPLPEATFDLVHARALLAFLPHPDQVIRTMVAALKPGGWLLLEEPDYVSAIPDPSMAAWAVALSQKAWDATLSYARSRGYDTELGRHLYHDVCTAGLVDVQTEGHVTMQLGGTPATRFWRLTVEQVQDQMLVAGFLTPAELETYRGLLESPEYRWLSGITMSVWGRRALA